MFAKSISMTANQIDLERKNEKKKQEYKLSENIKKSFCWTNEK